MSNPIVLNEINIDNWVDIISNFIKDNDIGGLETLINEHGSNGVGVWFRLSILLFGNYTSELEQRLKLCWFTDQLNLQERVERKLEKLGYCSKQSNLS